MGCIAIPEKKQEFRCGFLKLIIITFAGNIGSGKSTISSGIADATGWQRLSFGDFIREMALQRKLDQSRKTLQDLGGKLLAELGPEKFCINFLENGHWERNRPLIIDGIRHLEVFDVLKKIIAPIKVFLVFIEISKEIRELRLVNREVIEKINLEKLDSHSTESQVNSILRKVADLTIDGSKSVKDLTNEVVSWINQVVC